MPRPCTVCTHPDRDAIDRALAQSTPNRRIAAQYRLGEASVRRHRAEHLPATITKATEAAEVIRADSLLDQVRELQTRALALLDRAENGKIHEGCAALRECRATIELIGKLTGEIGAQAVNVRAQVVTLTADEKREGLRNAFMNKELRWELRALLEKHRKTK